MQGTTAVTVEIGNSAITFEAGLLAQQAAGAVTVREGDTLLISAVTATDTPREGVDYFPLQVEYREKFYAAGRFPGGFFKREARPSEKEILTARFTDRPIRPLFQEGYHNDVQINNMVLSADGENEADILSVLGASAALVISELPFLGPIGAVRVGRIQGRFVVNPTHTQRADSDLDLVYAGTRDLPVMIEGDAREIAEADLVAAMKFAHEQVVKLVDAQLELRRKLERPDKIPVTPPRDTALLDAARALAGAELAEAMLVAGKQDRAARAGRIKDQLKARLTETFPGMTGEAFRAMFDELQIEVVRANVLERGKRIGGRGMDELRPLAAQVGLLPRTHGSSLFSRGETQALGIVTLGTQSDSQAMDAITGGPDEKSFMTHYNFPPYSVGEVGRLGSTGRREIGHGALAERSLEQVMPANYPYVVRFVSDIMGSNGSTSMATVCAGTLALMDAGVPIRKPVAGISIGLFTGPGKAVTVVDILGDEDHCGDMDFKVAGTRDGITGFQVDLKIRGLTWDLVEEAFRKARTARLQILDFMAGVLAAPRSELSRYAPRVEVVRINPEKIGALIGPGGKNIRRITETTSSQIDIDDDGTVHIFAATPELMEMAKREVNAVVAEPEEGMVYEGPVTGVKEFGAFVEILPGIDGLVHISELADFRVRCVEDICKIGDRLRVKCVGVDDRGRVKLSRRAALTEEERNAEAAKAPPPEARDMGGESRRDHERRDHDRGDRRHGGPRRGPRGG
jgi:polyribonucleotide nucleotidyltransferase